jgi:hypothetical protein
MLAGPMAAAKTFFFVVASNPERGSSSWIIMAVSKLDVPEKHACP